ncbi:unnamed protein product [Coregonus sp. 'balchen']|nr:unnamed protein product [Coregonus sp. 'balchen']
MEEQQQHADALLERSGSQDVILPMTATRGASNSRAFKIAGFTVLACLLLAGQALTAYMVFNQRGQIHDMEKTNDNMRKQLRNRPPAVAPVQMHMPLFNMPRLIDFTEEDAKTEKTPMTKLEATAIVSLEKQVKDLLQGFETWARYWLLFQMAQEKPPAPPTPQPAAGLQTKCNLDKSSHRRKLGAYLPQCDQQGNYLPMQCWHATGFCWCVDKNGTPIEGTSMRGRVSCDGVPRQMLALPRMMQLKKNTEAHKLILSSVTVSSAFLAALINVLPRSKVDEIESTLEGLQYFNSAVTAMWLDNVTVPSSLLQPSIQSLHHWLLGPLQSLGLACSVLAEILCYFAELLRSLTHLDLSENQLSETSFRGLTQCNMTWNLTSINLRVEEPPAAEPIPHLHHKAGPWLPTTLEVLDLSGNALEQFDSPPQGLKELYLSHNRLLSLPSLEKLAGLQVSRVDGTSLLNGTGTEVNQGVLEKLNVIHAGENPYQCDCSLRETLEFLKAHTEAVDSVEDWPEGFVCDTLLSLQGTLLNNVSFPEEGL